MAAKSLRKPYRRPPKELSFAERAVLRMEESRGLRWLMVGAVATPAIIVAALFWANMPHHDAAFLDATRSTHNDNAVATETAVASHTPPGPAGTFTLPAEFERQQAIFLGCNELVQHHPQAMLDIINALQGRVTVYGLVEDEPQKQRVLSLLDERGLSDAAISLIELPMTGMWVRDSGPNVVRKSDDSLTFLDTGYLDGLKLEQRPKDDLIPVRLAAFFQQPVVSVPLSSEGGNILSNGQGIGITTDGLVRANVHRGYGVEQVSNVLRDYFAFRTWVVLPSLIGEPTSHVDLAVALTAPGVAVVGQIDAGSDPDNAEVLDRCAEILSQAQIDGGTMRVERIPMPPHADGLWRSYTNVIFANGVLLVPSYPDVSPELDVQAQAVYARLLPDWKIVPIVSSTLVRNHGMLRCVSANVPWPTHEPGVQPAEPPEP